MKLYDNLIDGTMEELEKLQGRKISFDPTSAWECLENTEFIMQRDAGLELGGAGMPSVNYTCVTTSGKDGQCFAIEKFVWSHNSIVYKLKFVL